MALHDLCFASCNMKGYRNGFGAVHSLCDTFDITAIQEHWLRPDEIDCKLSQFNHNFDHWAVYGMCNKMCNGPLLGRPFGGVGFLWKKSLSKYIRRVAADPDGKCLIVRVTLGSVSAIIVNVYFPCYEQSLHYNAQLGQLTGFIDDALSGLDFTHIIMMGDFNLNLLDNNHGVSQISPLLHKFNMFCATALEQSPVKCSYNNTALADKSRIGHFEISTSLRDSVLKSKVLDDICTESDHFPVALVLRMDVPPAALSSHYTAVGNQKYPNVKLRWDKGNSNDYYACSDVNLRLTTPDYDWLLCSSECSNTHHNQLINEYYANLVYALNNAAARTIPVIPCSALKPFWNDYLDELKEKSIFWQNIWVSSG